jgi:hypothetical protein
MAAWRRAIELSLENADVEKLKLIAQSRTEPASRVERVRILLGYWAAVASVEAHPLGCCSLANGSNAHGRQPQRGPLSRQGRNRFVLRDCRCGR